MFLILALIICTLHRYGRSSTKLVVDKWFDNEVYRSIWVKTCLFNVKTCVQKFTVVMFQFSIFQVELV